MYGLEVFNLKKEFFLPNVSLPVERSSDGLLNLFDSSHSSIALSSIDETVKKPTIENMIHNFPSQNVANLYAERIETLKELARDDGYDLHESSYANFTKFLEKHPRLAHADLVLLDNGNLRAIWKGENDAEIGLQFLQDSRVQYVLFNKSGPNSSASRPYGRGEFKETMNQIKKFDLDNIMFE